MFELLQPTAWALPDGRVTLGFPALVKVGSATVNAMSYSGGDPGKGGFWEQTGLSSAAAVNNANLESSAKREPQLKNCPDQIGLWS